MHLYFVSILASEGAFKKLKTEPLTSVGSISASHSGHTPTTATCPTPARRRHRTTFTQVSITNYNNYSYIAVSHVIIDYDKL